MRWSRKSNEPIAHLFSVLQLKLTESYLTFASQRIYGYALAREVRYLSRHFFPRTPEKDMQWVHYILGQTGQNYSTSNSTHAITVIMIHSDRAQENAPEGTSVRDLSAAYNATNIEALGSELDRLPAGTKVRVVILEGGTTTPVSTTMVGETVTRKHYLDPVGPGIAYEAVKPEDDLSYQGSVGTPHLSSVELEGQEHPSPSIRFDRMSGFAGSHYQHIPLPFGPGGEPLFRIDIELPEGQQELFSD